MGLVLLFQVMKHFLAFWIHFTKQFPQQVRYRFAGKHFPGIKQLISSEQLT